MSSTLIPVSAIQWIIEGWTMTRPQALVVVRDYLVNDRGIDEWDIDEAMSRVRIDRTWYSDSAGFVYAGHPDGRQVLIVTGLPRTGPEPESEEEW